MVQFRTWFCISCTTLSLVGAARAEEVSPASPVTCSLAVDVSGSGTVDVSSTLVPSGTVVTVTATPAAGMRFWKWTGTGATGANRYRAAANVTVESDLTLTANFYDPTETPRIVRYVKTAATGKKDGTSWDNAYGDITTAYNAVAANPSGGEVWLMKGRHWLNNAIAIVPNITVRGGFAGTETEASEADPATHVTILSHSSYRNGDQTWQDVPATPMWTGEDKMTFVDPPVTGDENVPFKAGYYGGGSAFTSVEGGLIENNEICGVSFFYYASWAVKVSSANVAPLVFRNCRFLASGWYIHNTQKVIIAENTPIEMYDCAFRGCQNPVFLTTDSTGSPVTSNVFVRCTFFACDANWNCKPMSAGITVLNNAKLTLKGCSFENCNNTTTRGSDDRGGALLLKNVPETVVEDTVIRCCVASNTTMAAGLVFGGPTNSTITIRRSRFEKCRYSGNGLDAHTSTGAAIGLVGTVTLNVSDSAFVGNSVVGSPSTKPAASVLAAWGGTGATNSANFANCTFEDNVSVDTTGKTDRFLITTAWNSRRYISFANCVFNNNTCGYTTAAEPEVFVRMPEFRKPNVANESQSYAFVNCVFANDAADYMPFANDESLSWGDDLSFANCVSSSSVGWGEATKNTFRYGVLANSADAPLKTYAETNGVTVARGIAADSVYRRSGCPVYRATDGDLYIYDTLYKAAKPWRLLRSTDIVCTPEEGAALGLSLDAPIPDAFGTVRSKRKCALGPLDWKVPGLSVIVW